VVVAFNKDVVGGIEEVTIVGTLDTTGALVGVTDGEQLGDTVDVAEGPCVMVGAADVDVGDFVGVVVGVALAANE
jgi:hypothetical protein